ncbi:hypothetical protein AB0F88_40115 [Streptosporangium sp. NPDC023963]|uniref:hypothetical protein n=1 Tax=Streptosporangium sp. NPDC023963 TaxID=3155608 RepID=UPI003449F3C5
MERQQCTAKSKRSGEQCQNKALLGRKTCRMHGSTTARSKAAGERRVVEAEAGALVRKLLADPDASPVENPVLELMRIVGRMRQAVDVLGEWVNEIEAEGRLEYTDGNLVRRIHVLVEAWERMMAEYRRALTDMAKLGIEERRVKLEEDQARQVSAALRAVFDRLNLTAEQRALISIVVPEEFRRFSVMN